jgi:hypothetical protein
MPEHRLADSRLVDIVAPAMSVVTAIGAVSLGSSLNEMNRALAGVVPTKQAPMSAIGTNRCFVLMDCLLHLTFPKVMSAFSAMVFLCRLWKYRRYNQLPAVGPACQQFFGQKALCLANDSRSQCRAIAVALKF